METTIRTSNDTVLNIPGMHCGGCARTIEKALRQVAGVNAASADAWRKIAEVAGLASAADLIAAVEVAGYDAEIVTEVSPVVDAQLARSKCCCG